jgi:hypothetical protein
MNVRIVEVKRTVDCSAEHRDGSGGDDELAFPYRSSYHQRCAGGVARSGTCRRSDTRGKAISLSSCRDKCGLTT